MRIKQSNCDLNGEKVRAINPTECHGSAAMRIYQIQSQIGAHLQIATDPQAPYPTPDSVTAPVSTSHPVTGCPAPILLGQFPRDAHRILISLRINLNEMTQWR